MISKTEKNLIRLCKACGLSKQKTIEIITLSQTDEIREQLIQGIIDRYDQKGEVTEEDIQKMSMMLTCTKKEKVQSITIAKTQDIHLT